MTDIVYGKLTYDRYAGAEGLSEEQMLKRLGYHSMEEFKASLKYEFDDTALSDEFENKYDCDVFGAMEAHNLEVLDHKLDARAAMGVFKVKGSREDFEAVQDEWFIVAAEEVDLEEFWIQNDYKF